MERKSRARAESLAFVAIVAASLVLVNILSIRYFARWDLTKRQLFTLSDGTARIVRGLHDQLTVTVYFTPNQPPPFNEDERLLRDQLDEYRQLGRGRVVVRFLPVEANNTQRQRDAEAAGCTKQTLQAVDARQEQATIQEAYRCLVFEYLGQRQKLELNQPGVQGLEYEISSIIKTVSAPANERERTIGFLGGHGENTPDEGMQYLPQLMEQEHINYRTRVIDLHGGENDVPADIRGLIIANPQRRIEERELRKLDAFLMRGGAIAVFAGGVNFASPEPTQASGAAAEHNLNTWFEPYGLRLEGNVVLDPRSPDAVIQVGRSRGRVRLVTWPLITAIAGTPSESDLRSLGGLDPSFPAVFRLPEFVTTYPSTIAINNDRLRQNGGEIRVFARTSPRSVLRTGDYDMNIIEIMQQGRQVFENATSRGPYVVGASLSGNFRSAFAGRPAGAAGDAGAPAATGDAGSLTGGANVPERAGRNARLMVVSSGSIFALDPLRTMAQLSGGRPANLVLLWNTFDWLSQDTDLLAVRAKDTSEPTLRADVSDTAKQIFKWGTIVGLPLAIGILGMAFMGARRSRRRAHTKEYGTPRASA